MKTAQEIYARLLERRGLTTEEAINRFVEPKFDRDLHDPNLFSDMEKAVTRICIAVGRDEKIAVFGDYDCDGVPGTVLLASVLEQMMGKWPEIYIPHRYNEGYGVRIEAVDALHARGVTLIVTVDTGITDVEAIAHARLRGIDVIVTDHHAPPAELPPALAILDPLVGEYPFKYLSGTGVAFKLAQALIARVRSEQPEIFPDGHEKWLLDLVGLATIADMVPLTGENRALAHFGLTVLRRTRRPGLSALYDVSRIHRNELTEDDVGFSLAPRVNAASRMDEPMRAFELLSASDDRRALELAHYLDRINNDRKRIVAGAFERVAELIMPQLHQPVLLFGNEEWTPGVLGLLASKAVDLWKRPVFVWGGRGEQVRGSCRSDGTVHLVELMNAIPTTHIMEPGGHEHAGGFSAPKHFLGELHDFLSSAYLKLRGAKPEEWVPVDDMLEIGDVTWDTHERIRKLAPYGVGNPKPLFEFRDVSPLRTRTFGSRGEHVEYIFRHPNGSDLGAVWFNAPPVAFREISEPLSFRAHIEKDTFRRPHKLRLRMVELM